MDTRCEVGRKEGLYKRKIRTGREEKEEKKRMA